MGTSKASKGKKKPHKLRDFESTAPYSDTTANIPMTMLRSSAWQDLSAQQKILYLTMKSQLYSKPRKPVPDDDECFTFNRSKWADMFGLYKSNNEKGFIRDRDALIEHGFIVCIEDGSVTRTKNIYKYSDKWKTWNGGEYKPAPQDMTASMRSARRRAAKTENEQKARDENRPRSAPLNRQF